MMTTDVDPSRRGGPVYMDLGGPKETHKSESVKDTISSAGTGEEKIRKPKAEDDCCAGCKSCWEEIAEGFRMFAQAIVDFFVNMFRPSDDVDKFRDKIRGAQLGQALEHAAKLIEWTRNPHNRAAMTDAEVRRANDCIQELFERSRVYDLYFSADAKDRKTVRQMIEEAVGQIASRERIDLKGKTPLQYMEAYPRSELVKMALESVANQDIRFNLQYIGDSMTSQEKDKTINEDSIVESLRELMDLYPRAEETKEASFATLYKGAVTRALTLLHQQNSKSLVLDGFDPSKNTVPDLSTRNFYEGLRDRLPEDQD